MTTTLAPEVDAHLHVWDLDRGAYAWIPPAGPLHRTFTPDAARTQLAGCGVRRAVLVQAEDTVGDTERMLEAAAQPWVAGVVGWVPLEDPVAAEALLDRWTGTALCGVRSLVHDDPRAGVYALPAVRRTLALVAARGLPLDVPDAWPRDLPDVAVLARELPDLRVVVDHLGKPPPPGPDRDRWRTVLAEVARCPAAVAKVSGLQVPGEPFTIEGVRPLWECALELFGPARLLWGSDWPMTEQAAGYAGTWAVLAELVAELSPDEQARVLGGTAVDVYGLAPVSRSGHESGSLRLPSCDLPYSSPANSREGERC
jgi:L-fuconolactonase